MNPELSKASRRRWLAALALATGGAALAASPVRLAWAATPSPAKAAVRRSLILVELAGGNDGLNTVVPYADARYAALRPRLALAGEQLIRLDARLALHRSLEALMPALDAGELAIVQGLGYSQPNLSHFRSIEIWDTASASDRYLPTGWLARALGAGEDGEARAAAAAAEQRTADGVLVAAVKTGVLQGAARPISLSDAPTFVRRARLAQAQADTLEARMSGNAALAHLLRAEGAIAHAALGLDDAGLNVEALQTLDFPAGAFGAAVRTAAHIIAVQQQRGGHVPVIVLRLAGFDTHSNQLGIHAVLLKQLADGLAALRRALIAIGHWQDTLVLSYSEFGRRARENQSGGTDHGAAAPQFVLGGAVRGGVLGPAPDLDALDDAGNVRFAIDFRRLYASVLTQFMQHPRPNEVLGGQFEPLPLLRSV